MALHALELGKVKAMNDKQRFDYFCKFAGRIPDSPKLCFAIRVGSTTLLSNDTGDLRQQFESFLGPRKAYRVPAAQYLRERGWKRVAGWSRNRNVIWWTKTDENGRIPQTLALKQQRAADRKARPC
jgi:hypothetical protein